MRKRKTARKKATGLTRLNGYVKNKTKQARKKRDMLIKKLKQAQSLLNKKRKAAIKQYKKAVK